MRTGPWVATWALLASSAGCKGLELPQEAQFLGADAAIGAIDGTGTDARTPEDGSEVSEGVFDAASEADVNTPEDSSVLSDGQQDATPETADSYPDGSDPLSDGQQDAMPETADSYPDGSDLLSDGQQDAIPETEDSYPDDGTPLPDTASEAVAAADVPLEVDVPSEVDAASEIDTAPPVDVPPACEPAKCDDGNLCNGKEICLDGKCAPGKAPVYATQVLGGAGHQAFFGFAASPDGGVVAAGKDGNDQKPWVVGFDAAGKQAWESKPDGNNYGNFYKIVAAPGGGYAAVGYGGSPGNPVGRFNRLDAKGNATAQKLLSVGGQDGLHDVTPSTPGSWWATGIVGKYPSTKLDLHVVRFDDQAQILLETSDGGPNHDTGEAVAALPDGGVLVAGWLGMHDGKPADQPDGWLIGYDTQGNKLVNRNYGKAGWAERFSALAPVPAQGPWPAGWIAAGDADAGGNVNGWIVRVDGQGEVMWQSTVAATGATDFFRGVTVLPDGGVVASGVRNGSELWLVRFDTAGNIAWQRGFQAGGPSYGYSNLVALAGGLAFGGQVIVGGGEYQALFVRSDAFGYLSCQDAGKCAGMDWKTCDDGNACTADDCSPADGTCSHSPHSGTCDAMQCNVGDTCAGGSCKASGKPKLWNQELSVASGQLYLWGIALGPGGGVVAALPGTGGQPTRVASYDATGTQTWQTLMGTAANGQPLTLWAMDRMGDGSFVVGGQWQDVGGSRRYTGVIGADGQILGAYPESIDGTGEGVAANVASGWWLAGVTGSAYGTGLSAQGYVSRYKGNGELVWAKYFGGAKYDYFREIAAAPGDLVVAAGGTESSSGGKYDGWLVGVGPNGQQLWEASFGGAKDDWFRPVVRAPDGGFVAGGMTESKGTGPTNAWLVKTSATGQLQWEQVWSFKGTGTWDTHDLAVLPGGFLVAGVRGTNVSPMPLGEGAVVVRTDAAGNKLWEWALGGPVPSYATSVVAAPDGGAFVGGVQAANNVSKPWIARIDAWGKGTCPLAGACASIPFGSCNDTAGPCTTPGCDKNKGCAPIPKPDGDPCDDGQPCSVLDKCFTGTCEPGKSGLWQKVYSPTNNHDSLIDAVVREDGSAVLVGRRNNPPNSPMSDGWLLALAPDGSELWNKAVGAGELAPSLAGQSVTFNGVAQVGANEWVAAGDVGTSGAQDGCLYRFDGKGGKISGGTWGAGKADVFYGVAVDAGGTMYAVGKRDENGGDAWAQVLKTTPGDLGAVLTTGGSGSDLFLGVTVASGGGALAVGATTVGGKLQGLAVRINAKGEKIYDVALPAPGNLYLAAVTALPAGFVAVGRTYAQGSASEATADAYLVRLSAGGTVQWERTWAAPGYDNLAGVVAHGSGFLVAGTSTGIDFQATLAQVNAAGGLVQQWILPSAAKAAYFEAVTQAGTALWLTGATFVNGAADGFVVRTDLFANLDCKASGTCLMAAKGCDDENPCTADLCDAAGCKHLPAANGTPCSDKGATCQGGKCPP